MLLFPTDSNKVKLSLMHTKKNDDGGWRTNARNIKSHDNGKPHVVTVLGKGKHTALGRHVFWDKVGLTIIPADKKGAEAHFKTPSPTTTIANDEVVLLCSSVVNTIGRPSLHRDCEIA